MAKIYKKKSGNKTYFHLGERFRILGKNHTLQVYLGKSVPKDLANAYQELAAKERELVMESSERLWPDEKEGYIRESMRKAEESRILWKYFDLQLSDKKRRILWRKFAVRFIFESNAIEGSKLTEKEVEKIVNKKKISGKKSRREVQEVLNSLKAFAYISSDSFSLNQRCIKELHAIVTRDLDIAQGYKKQNNVVNDSVTVPAGEVRSAMALAISQYKSRKKLKRHSFIQAIDFHRTFEHIHPFEDGNGRTGRLILIWMLRELGYGTILFEKKNRMQYWNSLKKADDGRHQKWHRFATATYRKTIKNLTEGKI